jgi:hypothetical protein
MPMQVAQNFALALGQRHPVPPRLCYDRIEPE